MFKSLLALFITVAVVVLAVKVTQSAYNKWA